MQPAQSELSFFHYLNIDNRLPVNVLESIKAEGKLERWGHNAIIHHDDQCYDLRLVIDGGVNLFEKVNTRSVQLKRGDVFGRTDSVVYERFNQSDEPTNEVELRAYDETTLCLISPDAFRELTHDYLGMIEASLGRWKKRRTIRVPVLPLIFSTAQSRVATVLLELVETDDHGGNRITTLPTVKLARVAGLDKATFQQELKVLHENGFIELAKRDVIIPDVDRLKSLTI